MPVYLYVATKEGTCLVAGTLGEGPAGCTPLRAEQLMVMPWVLSWCGPGARSGAGAEAGVPSPLRAGHEGRRQKGTEPPWPWLLSHDAGVPKVL